MPVIEWEDLLFLLLSGMLLVSALLVVTLRDIIRCGIALMVSFASLAGIYVMLGNPIVAATQVLVYIGAISVLILFAVMLTQDKAAPRVLVFQTQAVAAAIASVILAILIAVVVTATVWPVQAGRIWTDTTQLAKVLFGEYVLPFEVVSVLLLAAVVGGVYIAKRERGGQR
jgi:NADH-quinone oxidoreductase subunit J